ncbi:MAG: asparagine synthetase B, partial [Nitrososphaerota archaeon]|nr:asparagine synthetase B [Nitrososphaerota archaeon]
MCGINGINSSDPSLIREMNSIIKHRGPDDDGVMIDDRFSLGSCRLEIIDLTKRGHQPMSNEEGTIWIVYNGEIYNFKMLREELENRGHIFVSETDTEVIIHGYEEWGNSVTSKLEGMWAFALYDASKKIIMLSRDKMGIKPLYYVHDIDLFAFSSEQKVFTFDSLRRPIDISGLIELISYGFNLSRRTMLHGVSKLLAGE